MKNFNSFLKITPSICIYILTFIGSFIYTNLHAQTEPMYSQYMFNMLGVNPAYAGNREATSLNFFQRNQWAGIKGAPKTTSLSIDQSVYNGKLGWGVQAYDDRLGVESASGLNAMFSSRVRVTENGVLSGGMSLGLMNYRINLNDVQNRFNVNDPSFISTDKTSKWNPMIGLGIYFNTNNFYLGLSTPSILRSRLASVNNLNTSIQKVDDFHLFFNAGYVLNVGDAIKLKPSTMVKMVSGAPIQYDANLNIWFHDIIGIGGSYRTGDAIVGMAEIQATDNLRFGYAYDIMFSPIKSFVKGSHELMLRYEFGSFKTKIKSTRYF